MSINFPIQKFLLDRDAPPQSVYACGNGTRIEWEWEPNTLTYKDIVIPPRWVLKEHLACTICPHECAYKPTWKTRQDDRRVKEGEQLPF
uniref:Uncharacterized protein n=1 Tax=viral metagenome TaxID=1070528 RepID=A0A6M3IP37_9ZZZZ